jgi:3-hydroxy-D-aspartate aldolase
MPGPIPCVTVRIGRCTSSVDVLRLQQELGAAIGVCRQKVSEAEVFVRAGIKDVLVSNQVRVPTKIDRLARLREPTLVAVGT